MLFGYAARPLHEKDRLYYLLNPASDAAKTIDFSLNRLFEQARQSTSKGGRQSSRAPDPQ